MMKHIIYISIGFALLCAQCVFSQTTNEGQITVNPDTEFSTLDVFVNEEDAEFLNDGTAYFYNHLQNDGIFDYIGDSGLAQFIGTDIQNISGVKTAYFYNVLFDNQSASIPFHLSGTMDVNGGVSFFNGIVDNKNYGGRMVFEENAYHINTSDQSHVNGPVRKIGKEGFVFPIGDQGYYRWAGFSALSSLDLLAGQYYLENSDEYYPHHLREGVIEAIDDQEYWTIDHPDFFTANPQFISLTYHKETTPDAFLKAAEEGTLTILRWDEESNMWIDEGGTVNKDDQSVTTQVEKFGVFTLGALESDLVQPCHIVVYNAVTANGDGINDYFRIEDEGECAENLRVKVFNRWGVKVFESNNYGIEGDVFDGYSSGRLTVKKEKRLPDGTYFYTLEYEYDAEVEIKTHRQAGYLYLSGY